MQEKLLCALLHLAREDVMSALYLFRKSVELNPTFEITRFNFFFFPFKGGCLLKTLLSDFAFN